MRPRAGRTGQVLVTALVAVLILAFAAYALYLNSTSEKPTAGGTVVEGLVVDGPLSVLPPFAETQNSRDVAQLLYRGLTRTGGDGRAVPGLAVRWEIDQPSKTFTFHLRPGLRWSDGVPVTSADAAYTLSVLQSDALAGSTLGREWAGITVATPDQATVVYTLPSSSSSFIALSTVGLLPEHSLRSRPQQVIRQVVDAPTSGPFQIERVERDRLVLRRNPRALERAFLDELDLRLYTSQQSGVDALISGDVDLLAQLGPDDAGRVSGGANSRLVRAGSFTYVQLLFNQKQAALADPGVRQAVIRSLDRGAIIDRTLRGYARLDGSPIPPTISWAASPVQGPGRDPAAASAALDAAGWTRAGNHSTRSKAGQDLELHLVVGDLEPYRTIARLVQSDLAGAGVKVDVEVKPGDSLLAALEGGRFDMAVEPVDNGPDPDVFAFWHSSQTGVGAFNFSGMAKISTLDKDLEDGRFSSDVKVRHDAYANAQKVLRDQQVAAFLYSPDLLIGVGRRIKGFRVNSAIEPGQRYDYIAQWYVNSTRGQR